MKLTGDLEKKVNAASDQAEAKELIDKAGMLLTDDELAQVAGGLDATEPCPSDGEHKFTDSPAVFALFNREYSATYQICRKCGALSFPFNLSARP